MRLAIMLSAVGLLLVAACRSIQPVSNPQSFLPQAQPRRVWVSDSRGDVLVLENPRLVGDSVVGMLGGAPDVQAGFRLSEVDLHARQVDKRRTAIFIGALAVVSGVSAYMATRGTEKTECEPGAEGTDLPICKPKATVWLRIPIGGPH